eukprot:TRINITY_DN38590_c0_g1_i1.p1 TRINITY_DN38590_c0_g1~~TRINITY_DN38590_c0_g1_i1.p1  ORF type:complete len:220 (+),score=12.45 TRINITY_DN38590_c0_g1_i1:179-838(+)
MLSHSIRALGLIPCARCSSGVRTAGMWSRRTSAVVTAPNVPPLAMRSAVHMGPSLLKPTQPYFSTIRPALFHRTLPCLSFYPEAPRLNLADVNVTWVRSSGKGGQAVNKNSTKACIAFDLTRCSSITPYMAERLFDLFPKHVSARGVLVAQNGASREKAQNLAAALAEIQNMLDKAAEPPPIVQVDPRDGEPSYAARIKYRRDTMRDKKEKKRKEAMRS